MQFEIVSDIKGVRESGASFGELQFREAPMNRLIIYSPGGNGTGPWRALEMQHADTKDILRKYAETFPFGKLTNKQNLKQVICAIALDHYLSGKDTLFSYKSLAEMTGYSPNTLIADINYIPFFCERASQNGIVVPGIEWTEVSKGLFRIKEKG